MKITYSSHEMGEEEKKDSTSVEDQLLPSEKENLCCLIVEGVEGNGWQGEVETECCCLKGG